MIDLKLIEFFGPSDTGKTETIIEIVKKLKKSGYSVATIKSTKGTLNYEKDSKDSARYLQAGSELSVALSSEETVFHFPKKLSMIDVLSRLNYDYVVVEGDTEFPMPKILFASEKEGLERLDALTIAVVGKKDVISDVKDALKVEAGDFDEILKIVEEKALPPLPGDDCGHCKMTCTQMMEKIIKGEKSYKNCVKLANKGVKITVNGEELPALPFVSSLIRDVNSGVLKNLKGVGQGHVKIEFDFKG